MYREQLILFKESLKNSEIPSEFILNILFRLVFQGFKGAEPHCGLYFLIKNQSFLKFFVIFTMLFFASCSSPNSSCVKCHKDVDYPSKSHEKCVSCHKGNPVAQDKNESHRYMVKNPSSITENTCIQCHLWEFLRIKSSLMWTNTGIINKIQKIWEGDIENRYSAQGNFTGFNQMGERVSLKWIGNINNLGADLYRKFCSSCHLNSNSTFLNSKIGCSICHFDYTKKYLHKINPLPKTETCLLCHQRSGRIGLSYTGLYETNNLVPTSPSSPKFYLRGGRSLIHVIPDVHYKAGMECIDCHTSRDIMGDGYLYFDKEDQVEIGCEDCHGSGSRYPKTKRLSGESYVFLESKNYKNRGKIYQGRYMVLTKKGRMYSNVYMEDKKVYVIGKRSGKVFESPVITNSVEHSIYGHERLKCEACHSRVVPQCFGCHTYYFKDIKSYDRIKKRFTHGKFLEKEDLRRPYYFILGVNKNNKITTLTPGCETFIYIKEGSKWIKTGYVTKYKGKRQFRFAPIFSHNISKKAIGCIECHSNFYILGFGKGEISNNGTFNNIFICPRGYSLDGLIYKSKDGKISSYGAVVGKGARPLSLKEIKKILKVNQCLICHEKDYYIFKKPIDYSRLNICEKLYLKRSKGKYPSRRK